jgi:hypothetical protein
MNLRRMTSPRTSRLLLPSPSQWQRPFSRMTAAEMTAAIAKAMHAVETSEAMTTVAQARVLAGPKAAPDPVDRRLAAALRVTDLDVVRPAVRRCVVRAMTMTMTTTTTDPLGHAVRTSAGPAWVPVARAGCLDLEARRSLVVTADSVADSAVRHRSAACLESPASAAAQALAAVPAPAAGRTVSMTASLR